MIFPASGKVNTVEALINVLQFKVVPIIQFQWFQLNNLSAEYPPFNILVSSVI